MVDNFGRMDSLQQRRGGIVSLSPAQTPRSSDKSARESRSSESNSTNRNDKEKGVNVQVILRCRPLSEDEARIHTPVVISCNENRREVAATQSIAGKHIDRHFAFDKLQDFVLSSEAKAAAADIEERLQLGSKLSDVIHNKEEAIALFDLYRNEGYILTEHRGRFCVMLKESSTPQDMLRSLFQVNYLYWLEKNAGIEPASTYRDCKPGGRLHISLDYVRREFEHAKEDSESVGWVTEGLIARPLPTRIRLGHDRELLLSSPNSS